MKVRNTSSNYGYVGEVIDWSYNLDDELVFTVIWYGKPGVHQVLADYLEVVK